MNKKVSYTYQYLSRTETYYIANKFDFDGEVLTEALRKTFSNREHSFTRGQFDQVMSFADDAAMQKKWKAFVRKINTKTDDYSTVLKTIKMFLTKPFEVRIPVNRCAQSRISGAPILK